MKTTFANHLALSELPYFRVNEAGRLSLAIDLGYAAIDMHTHLALAYGHRSRLDLAAEHPRTRHYLPVESALDLDAYANRNIPPDDLKRMGRDLTFGSLTDGGMRVTHTAANLGREMRELGVGHAVLLPIEMPILSGNAAAFLEVARATPGLLSFGSIHPLWSKAGERLEGQKRLGARGVKLHPAVQMFSPDSRRAMKIYSLCGDLQLPVLLHAGPVGIEPWLGRRLSQMRRYELAVREHPRTTFVLGHAGALQPEVGIELARRYPNVWLELSGQGLSSVQRILKEAPQDRLLLGSDWPFYHLAVPLSKLLIATENDAGLRRAILRDNAARLLGLA